MKSNPYENSKDIEIPEFINKHSEQETEETVNKPILTQAEIDEILNEEKPNKVQFEKEVKKVKKPKHNLSLNVALYIASIVSLALAVFSTTYALLTKNQIGELQTKLDTIKVEKEALIETNNKLQLQIEDLKVGGDGNVEPFSNTTILQYQVITPTYIRSDARQDAGIALYENMPDYIKAICTENSMTKTGSIIEVKELKEVDGYTWALIGDYYWFCVSDGQEVFAHKY